MSTRAERRAQRRKQRADSRGGRSVPWFTLLVVAVVLVGAFVGLKAMGAFEPPAIAPPQAQIDTRSINVGSGPAGQKQDEFGNRSHAPDGQPIDYPSRPPTSGPHWATPLPWGNYDGPQPDERVIHNLEHGGIVISYNQISASDVASLKGLRGRYPRDRFGSVKIITRPYDKIAPGTIALTAWQWLDSMQGYDEERVLRFLVAHMNECCEPVP